MVCTVYMTALECYYVDERDHGHISASTLDYLTRALALAKDQTYVHEAEEVLNVLESAKNPVAMAYEFLTTLIRHFRLGDNWSSPPLHKLCMAVSVLRTTFEAHRKISKELKKQFEEQFEDSMRAQGEDNTQKQDLVACLHSMTAVCSKVCTEALDEIAVICSEPTNYALVW